MNTSTPDQFRSPTLRVADIRDCPPRSLFRKVLPVAESRPPLDRGHINELMAAVAQRQDVEAYEVLYKHFVPKVRSYMFKIGADRVLAEEMVQEAMFSVWRKANQFDAERGAASTWIYTIARNVRIDALRRGPRPDFDINDPTFVPGDTPAADVAFDREQDAERLREAMASLKADEIKALRMSFFDDMTHPAIATTLGIPIGTVKSRIRNACLKLRTQLKDE